MPPDEKQRKPKYLLFAEHKGERVSYELSIFEIAIAYQQGWEYEFGWVSWIVYSD